MTLISKFKKKFYFVAASYFKLWANISLKKWHPRIIMITGSAGKTTMLNLVESQLGAKAHYSHNANSAFGISFDLLGLNGVRGSKLRWIYLLIMAPIYNLSLCSFCTCDNVYVHQLIGKILAVPMS